MKETAFHGRPVERHYANLKSGSMHYLRAGEGPPVIVLHASPMSAWAMLDWVSGLAREFTVYAPDTAGFGQSDPLPCRGEAPTIADYARRVLEFADAVGLDRFLLGGTHTGAKLALEVSVQAPERVAQLVMDGLGLYTSEEMADQLERYTPPIVPVWHGAHLVEVWHRLRNMWIFWPWYRHEAGARLADAVPPIEDLHQMVLDSLRAKPDWGLAYRAAFRYEGRQALARLSSPAVLIAKEADPLHEHLARLGLNTPTLEVRSVANADHVSSVLSAFDRDSALADAPSPPPALHDGGTSHRYVRTSLGDVHVRMDGDPAARPVLFVHGSPGSADSFDPLIRELARDHLVVAPDTLGNGYSDPAPGVDPGIDVFAEAVAEVLTTLGLGPVTAYGRYTGACIALELAVRHPSLVRAVVADGLPIVDEQERVDLLENAFVSLAPERHGEHLVRAWHTIRDGELWWPWYRQDAEHRRPAGPSEPEVLHRLVVEFLKSGSDYWASYAAALRFPSLDRLAESRVRTIVCAEPEDVWFPGIRQAGDLAGVTFVRLDAREGTDAVSVVRQVIAD